jgi:uncharacterized protein
MGNVAFDFCRLLKGISGFPEEEEFLKLLVLYLSEDTVVADDLKQRFHSIGIETEFHVYRSNWDRELVALIGETSHVMVLLRKRSLEKKTSAFVLGFCLGRGIPLFVYQMEEVSFPLVPGPLFRSDDPDAVMHYFRGEKKIWTEKRKKEEARQRIISQGLGVSDEAMANVTAEGEVVPLKWFLEAGFSPDVRDKNGVPLICLAVRRDHKLVLEQLISCGADIDAISMDRGNTALMDAAADRKLEIMNLLIDSGASLDMQSKNGQTALILSVGQKAVAAAEILLSAGADYTIKDALGMSAKKYAELFGLSDLLKLMSGA